MAATTMATMSLLNAKCSVSPKTVVKLAAVSPPKKVSLQNTLIQKLPAMAVLAALGACEPAVAAQQIADVAAAAAEGDNRGLALLLPVAPALGWVLYNILQPALNQLNRMRESKGALAAAGLGGLAALGLIYSPEAEAAVDAATAAGDNRGTLLLVVIAPAIGWVLYNILQPALNQLNKMSFLSLYALSLTLISSSPTRHQSRFVSLTPLSSPSSSSSSSSSRSRCSASTVEEEEGVPVQSTSIADEPVKFSSSGCEGCGRGEVEKGCNGKGTIQGGIATIPGFGWWPIKAYRPCPAFLASGGRYQRQGQSMDQVVSGTGK